jgi:hypothetical protein
LVIIPETEPMLNSKTHSISLTILPLVSVTTLVILFGEFGQPESPEISSTAIPAAAIDPIEAQLTANAQKTRIGHPLHYNKELGVYSQSDHSEGHYEFAPEALAQRVPSPAEAAGLRTPANENTSMVESRQVIHADANASDADSAMTMADDGSLWVAYTSFRDGDENVYAKRREASGEWGEEHLVGNSGSADFSPAIGIGLNGEVWVVWVRQEAGESWPLVARSFDGNAWGDELTISDGRCYKPTLLRLPTSKRLAIAFEDWSSGISRIHTAIQLDAGWSDPSELPGPADQPQQRPAMAVTVGRAIWLAYDVVVDQKYEIRLASFDRNGWQNVPNPPSIEGHRRRASIATDREGRVWVLPETEVIEPIQVRRAPNGQDEPYNVRPPARAMLVWDGAEWKALPRGPAMTAKAATLHTDASGSVWIFARTPGGQTRDFILVAQRYRGDKWYAGKLDAGAFEPKPNSPRRMQIGGPRAGSIKQTVPVVGHNGKLHAAWHATQRQFVNDPAWTYADGAVHTVLHTLKVEDTQYVPAELVDYDASYHGTEAPGVKQLPHIPMARPSDETFTVDGEEMRVYYGDMHHHTEFSRDPGVANDDVDGNYRYVRDVRQLNFEGLADHAEHVSPYDWYRIRRTAAFYNQGEHFAALAAFEWTSEFYSNGNYQEGHHNIVYRTDGPEVKLYSASLPESNTPLRLIDRVEADIAEAREQNIDANMLLFPHDPSRWVQPISWSWYHPRIKLLELAQSRGNHEHLGSPQKTPLVNDFQQQMMGKSAQDGLAKGLRWGFVGSGDHRGRPIAGVLAPAGDRESIFDSMYAKRTFATTGAPMVVDVSVNGHRMGSEWSGSETEHSISIHAKGSEPITFVELWKNGRMLWRWSPVNDSKEFKVTHKDPSAPYHRENWWYVRVTQADGHLAWSSPVWFVYEGIEAKVVADAGGPEPHYITPGWPIPIPVLMRNQKSETVTGKLELTGLPEGWELDVDPEIAIELPPDSWTTYVWYITAPTGVIDSLRAVPLALNVNYSDGASEQHRITCVQSPTTLNTRGQLSELNDAVFIQKDIEELNKWLATMAKRWNISE